MRIKFSRRADGQVADVIGTGAFGVQNHDLDAAEELRSVFGFDQAHLEIGAYGDLTLAGGQVLGGVGDFPELP